MFPTIAICTFNRAESLRRTLRSLAALRIPDHFDWEIVVVNNNCTDHTDHVIASFSDWLPVRREFELQRGLSWARNRAVHAAKGNYIVWIDDDVLVPADTVVIAIGQQTEGTLGASLRAAGIACHSIGGATSATGLDAVRAFADGLDLGTRLTTRVPVETA